MENGFLTIFARTTIAVLLLSLSILNSPGQLADAVVGGLGDSAKIQFEGQQRYSAESLRRSLQLNLDFLLASQPQASRAKYLQSLEKLLVAGYQHAGFEKPVVHATVDESSQQIRIRIQEGLPCQFSEVKITGLKTLSQSALLERVQIQFQKMWTNQITQHIGSNGQDNFLTQLLTPSPTNPITGSPGAEGSSPPPSLAGKRVFFDARGQRRYTEVIKDALADLGYLYPRFETRLEIQPATAAATNLWVDLMVQISDEGLPSTIGSLVVKGARTNSTDVLLHWLGLAPGQLLARTLIEQKTKQIMDSGRFISGAIIPETPAKDGRTPVRVEITELPSAPPVNVALSREAMALEKFRAWFCRWQEHEEDFVAEFQLPGPSFFTNALMHTAFNTNIYGRLILGCQGGMIFRTRMGSPTTHTERMDLAVGMRHGWVGLYDLGQGRKFTSTNCTTSVNTMLAIDMEKDGKSFLTISGGFSSSTSAPPFEITTRIAPSAIVKEAYQAENQWHLENDLLTCKFTKLSGEIRIDARTGRLLQFNLAQSMDGATNASANEKLRIYLEKGALHRAEQQLEQETLQISNSYEPGSPAVSLMRFLAMDFSQSPLLRGIIQGKLHAEKMVAASTVLGKLCTTNVFAPLALLFETTKEPKEDLTLLPLETSETEEINPMAVVAPWVMYLGRRVLPLESWAEAMLRQTALRLTGRDEEAGKICQKLYDTPALGPVGNLAFSFAVNMEAGRMFATKGLTHLATEHFQNDCRDLFRNNCVFAQCVTNLARELRNLNDQDANTLAVVLPKPEAAMLRELRRNPEDKPPDLEQALAAWWEQGLKDRVASELRDQMLKRAK